MHIKLSVVTWILCVTLVTLEKRPKAPIHHKLGSSLQELQNVCADRVYVKYMSKKMGGEIKRLKSFFSTCTALAIYQSTAFVWLSTPIIDNEI